MVKKIFGFAMILQGVFVMKNPTFAHRGGITDLSYMNFNIILGFSILVFGFYILLHSKKID